MKKLPLFGVGPIYGIICFIISLGSWILCLLNVLEFSEVHNEIIKVIFIVLGIILIISGIIIWSLCALGKKNIIKYIKEDKLCTTGIYSIVRNPCYTGISFTLVGISFLFTNYLLLILPVIFYLFLTILMINTEEKWLKEKYQDEYLIYMKKVNRVIPWFKRK